MTISSGMPMLVQRMLLEFRDVEIFSRGQFVEIEIDQRGRDIFDGGEALIEGARRLELLDQRFRHGFAGFVVLRVGAQDFRPLQPVLVELRRQFDKVGRDAGAGNVG